jgi:hypothetical protein
VIVFVIALFTYHRSRSNALSKKPRVSRDVRESEPLDPSVSPGDPFVEYRGEPEEDLGAPERSPVDGRSSADLLRSDVESIPEVALGRVDRD